MQIREILIILLDIIKIGTVIGFLRQINIYLTTFYSVSQKYKKLNCNVRDHRSQSHNISYQMTKGDSNSSNVSDKEGSKESNWKLLKG